MERGGVENPTLCSSPASRDIQGHRTRVYPGAGALERSNECALAPDTLECSGAPVPDTLGRICDPVPAPARGGAPSSAEKACAVEEKESAEWVGERSDGGGSDVSPDAATDAVCGEVPDPWNAREGGVTASGVSAATNDCVSGASVVEGNVSGER